MPIRATSSDPRRFQLQRIPGTGADPTAPCRCCAWSRVGADLVHAQPLPIRATSSGARGLQLRRITETGANPTALRGLTNAAECWNRRGSLEPARIRPPPVAAALESGVGADLVHAQPLPIRVTFSDPRELQLQRIAEIGADRG
ncbi:hypothetical protein [Rhodococcoides kroppenstedtii]|uniref:hypothetical protein n=1 Tax=Rhodococcoides kroppenstedtii TaxID=293050 RepID=UPI0028EC7A64|nr:hypothetical protein [Rhodococcus kroppenstedtii]